MKNSTIVALAIIAVVIIAGIVWYFGLSPGKNPLTIDNVKADTVKLSSKTGMGNFLVDEKGMTLYYFPKDNINKSNCSGQCLIAWPIFYSEDIRVSSPLKRGDFGEITATNGQKQSAYKGWPLYYYQKDTKPGDTLGEGVGDVWYIMPEPFYTVMTQNKEPFGNYLVDPKGMTLYYFTRDTRGTATTLPTSTCTGQCLAAWPIFYADNIIAPSLLKKPDFSVLNRADGTKQLVYKGWPLYYYAGDKNPGDTTGDNVNGVWFVVKP